MFFTIKGKKFLQKCKLTWDKIQNTGNNFYKQSAIRKKYLNNKLKSLMV